MWRPDAIAVRVGILGAARINRSALLTPARAADDIEITAIAARDRERASAYAGKHGIPVVHTSYDALLADPYIDAVYIPLPPALHGRWTLAAIAAGKHVLVEKPFTANAAEAREVEAAAEGSGLVIAEAHHTSFHPFTARLREIVQSGVLGEIRSASAWFHAPIPPGKDIRWNPNLGGGSLMDLGVYPVRMIRDVLGEPVVIGARARHSGDIDQTMTADLAVGGVPVLVRCGMWSGRLLAIGLTVDGSHARLRVRSPFQPHFGALRVDGPSIRLRQKGDRKSSYRFQLEAFRDAVLTGGPTVGNPSEAAATMQIVDDIYRAASMEPRHAM